MSNYGRYTLSLLLLGLGVGGFLAMGRAKVGTRPARGNITPLVETIPAAAHQDGIAFEVDGLVVPYREVAVATEVDGRVEFKADGCRTGQTVRQGELLLRIDQRDYELEVVRLNEDLKQAEASLEELELETENITNQIRLTEEQLQIDQRELKRNENLGASGALSESEVDKVRRTELVTRNTLQSLVDQKSLLSRRQTRLTSATALVQAQLDKARLELERTEIRAPMDGVVVSENVEQDGYVQRGSTVITLQDTSRLDVTCKLHMQQMHWLWLSDVAGASAAGEAAPSWGHDFPDTPAKVVYELGGASFAWDGVLNRYDGAGVDNQTRMVPCRAHVTAPLAVSRLSDPLARGNPPTLMTGMFVKVRIHARPPISLIRLPQRAVQPGNAVWTVENSKLCRKAVELAHSDGEFVLVYAQEDGVRPGDEVVVSPLATPLEGLEVEARAAT